MTLPTSPGTLPIVCPFDALITRVVAAYFRDIRPNREGNHPAVAGLVGCGGVA
jgi:hypothetical protein